MVENHLNSAMMIRSSDVFVGLPYDVMGHALLMDAISKSIGAQGLGWLHVTLAHPHVYETHYEMARTSLDQTWAEKPKLPGWMVEEIVEDPDGYVAAVKDLADEVRPHPYFCRPEVVV
jgi:thymidylate synthase